MVTCPTCQTENPNEAVFCRKCGSYLRWEDRPPGPGTPQGSISIQLAADALSVTPGAEGGCDVWIRNAGSEPVEVALDLYDSAADWSSVEPAALQVPPGGQGRAHIRLLPPASGSTAQGPRRLGVRATPGGVSAAAVSAEAVVAVAGVVDFRLSIDPTTSNAYRTAAHRVLVENTGNAPVVVQISASDGPGELSFDVEDERLDIEPAGTAETTVTAHVLHPKRVGRAVEREFQVAATDDRVPPRHATGIVRTTPSVPASLLAVFAFVLVLGLVVVGFATIGQDDDSPFSCPAVAVPASAAHHAADFDGGGDDSVATYLQNGVVHVVALVDQDHGRDIAIPNANGGARPLGSTDVDGDDLAEAWIVRSVNPFSGREILGLLTFKPPCTLVLLSSPLTLTSASPNFGLQCRDVNGAHLVVTAGFGNNRYLRLAGSQLVTVPGNPAPAPAGFSCGSLSRSAP